MKDPDVVESDERFVIHAPVEAVERMLTDASAGPRWRTCMQLGVEASSPVLRPGTTLEFVVRCYGLSSAYTQIVSQYVPGAMLALRTTRGKFFVDTTYEWAEEHGRTWLRCHERLRLPRNKRLVGWLAQRQFLRELRTDHRRLKHLLETERHRYPAPLNRAAGGPGPESLQDTRD